MKLKVTIEAEAKFSDELEVALTVPIRGVRTDATIDSLTVEELQQIKNQVGPFVYDALSRFEAQVAWKVEDLERQEPDPEHEAERAEESPPVL